MCLEKKLSALITSSCVVITRVLKCIFLFVGYDQVPVDSMQGLDIGSHHGGSTYGPMDAMDVGGPGSDLNFDLDPLPQPPQDNNQVAAWYDTDL